MNETYGARNSFLKNQFEVFKKRFMKAWTSSSLMPQKDRQRMALEAGIGDSEALKDAWSCIRRTKPGQENQELDLDALKLGRQMAGYMGRVVRTERMRDLRRQPEIVEKAKRGNGRTTSKAAKKNGRAAPAMCKSKTIPVPMSVAMVVGKGRQIEVDFYFRKACEYGMTPAMPWWEKVYGVSMEFLYGLKERMEGQGWTFGLEMNGVYTTACDPRRAEVIKLEKEIEGLRKRLEALA